LVTAARATGSAIELSALGLDLPLVPSALAEIRAATDGIAGERPACAVCGQSTGRGEETALGCASCRGERSPVIRTVRLAEYGGALATRILQAKHLRWHAMAEGLGTLLGTRLTKAIASTDPSPFGAGRASGASRPTVLVPIPMPFIRRMVRGIDHTHEIAKGIRRVAGFPIVRLLRQHPTGTQVGRSPTERRRNRGRFRPSWLADWRLRRASARWGVPLDRVRVILIDDVRTTGGTVEQAARVVRDLGISECWAAVLAVAADPARRPSGAG
jgi:predicted amidophosphoribosyltransferase